MHATTSNNGKESISWLPRSPHNQTQPYWQLCCYQQNSHAAALKFLSNLTSKTSKHPYVKGKLKTTEKYVQVSEVCFLLEYLMNAILNSFTIQEATEIPKMYFATSLLASIQCFFPWKPSHY